jgi:hypothetical protein
MQRLNNSGWRLNVNRGQIRIFEAVVATAVIFVAFSASILLIYPSRLWLIYEREYLDRLGYNILHNLAETGAIESVLGEDTYHLEIIMNRIMPLLTYYNLTIFVFNTAKGEIQRFASVSNATPEVFRRMPEVSSTMMVYTSRSGKTYYLVLVLAKGGEKS